MRNRAFKLLEKAIYKYWSKDKVIEILKTDKITLSKFINDKYKKNLSWPENKFIARILITFAELENSELDEIIVNPDNKKEFESRNFEIINKKYLENGDIKYKIQYKETKPFKFINN